MIKSICEELNFNPIVDFLGPATCRMSWVFRNSRRNPFQSLVGFLLVATGKNRVDMNRFVAPLGFSGHRVTRPVIAYGTNPGDQVVLVHPEQSEQSAAERVDTAVTDIEATLSAAVRNGRITRKAIDTSHFDTTVDRCSEILTTDKKPVVCIGGGSTDIHVPMIVATLAHTTYIEDIMMFRDIENAAGRVDFPHLTTTIPGRTEPTFQSLAA